MKKQFENIEEITDRSTYDAAMKYLNEIVKEGTQKGYFKDPEKPIINTPVNLDV